MGFIWCIIMKITSSPLNHHEKSSFFSSNCRRLPKSNTFGALVLGGPRLRDCFCDGFVGGCRIHVAMVIATWWLVPLSKWVITPIINGISKVNPHQSLGL